jgi:hypothetical protein
MLAAIITKLGLGMLFGRVGAIVRGVPPKVWLVLGVLALLAGGVWWHGRATVAHDKALIAATDARWEAKLTSALAQAKVNQDRADAPKIDAQINNAEKIDDLSVRSAERTRAAVAAYARAHPAGRCLRAAALDRGSSGDTLGAAVPGDPGQPAPAPAGDEAELVAVPRPELDYLARGAVQDAIKTRFLNGLIESGYAVRLSTLDDTHPTFGTQ